MTEPKRVLVKAGWLAMLVSDHERQHRDLQTAYAALRAVKVLTRKGSVTGKIVRNTIAQLERTSANYEEPPTFTKDEARQLLRDGLSPADYVVLAREVDKEMGGEEWAFE